MVSLSVMFAQRLACCMKFLRQFWSLVEIFLQHANAAKFEQIHRGCSQTMLKMLGFFWQHLLMTEWTPLLKLTARYGSLSFWVSRRSMLGRNVFFFFFVSAAVSCIKIYSEVWAEKKNNLAYTEKRIRKYLPSSSFKSFYSSWCIVKAFIWKWLFTRDL